MTDKAFNIYQFKITLKDISPKIWRRILVPEKYSFWDLHVAIQDAMGWKDCHLHEFEVINPAKYGAKDLIGIPDPEFDEEVIAGWKAKISKYFLNPKDKATYTYDFGDWWAHEVLFEKMVHRVSGATYPQCISGKRACPPEDCGGVPGYAELLEILSDPKHVEYKERMEWLEGGFNPEQFAPKSIIFDDPAVRRETLVV